MTPIDTPIDYYGYPYYDPYYYHLIASPNACGIIADYSVTFRIKISQKVGRIFRNGGNMAKTESGISTQGLPEVVHQVMSNFIDAAKNALGNDLRSVVLYGSGAEGKLRSTSDVNLILILLTLDQKKLDQLREPFRVARAAIRLTTMFLLESEIKPAVESFSVKFVDILHRHKVLFGTNVFSNLVIPREVTIARLKQVLLNLSLRLREQYMLRSLREEQLVMVIADATGPLRACAATILELKEKITKPPKEALQDIVHSFSESQWEDTLTRLSQARGTRMLPPGIAGPTLFKLIELADRLRSQVENLS